MNRRRRPVISGNGELPSGDGTNGRPFSTYDALFSNQMQTPFSVFGASPVSGAEDREKKAEQSGKMPIGVSLPPHLFIPADAQSVDISALANVPPATTVDLLTFRGPAGGITKFLGYSIFNDALSLATIELTPLVDDNRVFPFHGNPQLNFKMGLGLGPDMQVLVPCQLDVMPGQIARWVFTNNDVVDIAVGVRMSGYYAQDITLKTGRFGG